MLRFHAALSCLLWFVSSSSAESPSQHVTHVYVAKFQCKAGSPDLRNELIAGLRKSGVDVVNSPTQASETLTGETDIYVKSYVSLNPRAGRLPGHGRPIYAGDVSIELKNSAGETLWSYFASVPSGTTNATHDVCKELIRHLVSSLRAAQPADATRKP